MTDREIIDNIRKFWLLRLIVDTGNFKDAAAKAKVTQSALSQTVTQVEHLTGRVLLRREKGRVEPTVHCVELLNRIQPVLTAISEVTREQEDVPPIAWLSLGTYETFAGTVVPSLITNLQLKCPGIRLTLRVGRSGSLASMVRKGDLCMAIIQECDDMGRLDVLPVTTDRLGFWASPSHPAVAQGWTALGEHEVGVIAPDIDGHPRYYIRLMEAANLGRHPMFVSDSYESLRAAAAQGALVAMLPERLASAVPGLVEIKPQDSNLGLGVHRICLVSRAGCDPRENDFLLAELKEVVAKRDSPSCQLVTCGPESFSTAPMST